MDAFGNVILTGTIGSTLTIDGNDLHHAGGKDILFARFAPDGSTLHATTIGGSKDDEGLSVTIAANGDYISVASEQHRDRSGKPLQPR